MIYLGNFNNLGKEGGGATRRLQNHFARVSKSLAGRRVGNCFLLCAAYCATVLGGANSSATERRVRKFFCNRKADGCSWNVESDSESSQSLSTVFHTRVVNAYSTEKRVFRVCLRENNDQDTAVKRFQNMRLNQAPA